MLILAIICAYLFGAIPVGYILTKLLKGIDIRHFGSGNVGATNVFRAVGPFAGTVVLILDILKGLISVTLLGDFLISNSTGLDPLLVRLFLAVAAVAGHNWTIFLEFKGGKGIATTVGVLLGLSFKLPALGLILGLCLGIWALVVLVTGYISLGSIIAACALPISMSIFNQPVKLIIFSALLCVLAIYRHNANIRRLLHGEEKSVFQDNS